MSNNIAQIFVRLSNRTITIDMPSDMSVDDLYQSIHDKTGIPSEVYFLSYSSKILDSRRLLRDYNIRKESTIHLVIKHPPVISEPLLKRPRLERSIGEHKWSISQRIAKEKNYPCMAQVDYDNNFYYIISPNGIRYTGTKEFITNQLDNDGYQWEDVISIEEARDIVFNI